MSESTDKSLSLDAIATVHDDDNLRLRFLPGRSRDLVLAITGVGRNIGGQQTEEFVGSASSGGERNVLFVIDKKRSWFTQPGVIEQTRAHSLWLIEKLGCKNVTTLGNSMGGYGAILMAKYLPVRTAIAFAPQYSMNRLVVFERRWRTHRKEMHRAPILGLNAAIFPGTQYFIVYGDDPQDRKHRKKFKSAPNISMTTVFQGGHNPAQRLKDLGVLTAVLDAALNGDVACYTGLMDNLGAARLTP